MSKKILNGNPYYTLLNWRTQKKKRKKKLASPDGHGRLARELQYLVTIVYGRFTLRLSNRNLQF